MHGATRPKHAIFESPHTGCVMLPSNAIARQLRSPHPLENPVMLLPASHSAQHSEGASRHPLMPPLGDLLRVGSRRWFLQTGLAGLAGLTSSEILRARASASASASRNRDPRAVVLFWLSGGPSHIDT